MPFIMWLPLYSPDIIPIKKLFSKVKMIMKSMEPENKMGIDLESIIVAALHQKITQHWIKHLGIYLSHKMMQQVVVKCTTFNSRCACAARVTVVGLSVCLSVCVSVSQHLTSGVSLRLENAVTHSAGSEGQNDQGNFPETARLQTSSISRIVRLSFVGDFSLCGKTRMRIYIYYHV